MNTFLSFAEFLKVDIRVGRIVDVQDFPKARVPSFQLKVDLGPGIGIKCSAAHLPQNYRKEELFGRQVLCVVNFPAKQIANFMSEVLVLGVPNENGEAILIAPEREVALGGKVF